MNITISIITYMILTRIFSILYISFKIKNVFCEDQEQKAITMIYCVYAIIFFIELIVLHNMTKVIFCIIDRLYLCALKIIDKLSDMTYDILFNKNI